MRTPWLPILLLLGAPMLAAAQEPRPQPRPMPNLPDPGLVPELLLPLARGDVLFSGLPHRALGNARLRPQGGALFVEGFGASGQDGVHVRFGPAEYFLLRFPRPIMATDVPDGATLTVTVRGPQGEPLGRVRGVDIGAVSRNEVDFRPIGSPTHTLTAFRGGQELVEIPGREGVFIQMPLPAGFRTSVMPDGRLCIMLMWDQPTKVEIEGGPTVEADQLFLQSEGPRRLPARHVREMELTGARLGRMHISSSGLGLSKREVVGLGDARLTARAGGPTDGGLVAIAGKGSGGVRARFGAVSSGLVRLGSIVEARHGRDGGTLTVAVRDTAGRVLGRIRALDGGDHYRQTADFGPLGTRAYTIRIEHDGKVVAELPGDAGTTYIVPGLGGGVRTSVMADGSLCIMFMWDQPQPVRIEGGPSFMATRLFHISKGGRRLPPDAIASLELAGSGFPPIELSEIQVPVLAKPEGGTP